MGELQLTTQLVNGTGDQRNQFVQLNGNQLTSTRTFDFETEATHFSIRVEASASNGASQIKNFTVQINDVFENRPPLFTSFNGSQSAEIQIIENQTVVAKFSAEDPDAQSLVFLLSEDKSDFPFFPFLQPPAYSPLCLRPILRNLLISTTTISTR